MYDIFWEADVNILKTNSPFLSQKSISPAISPSSYRPTLTPPLPSQKIIYRVLQL